MWDINNWTTVLVEALPKMTKMIYGCSGCGKNHDITIILTAPVETNLIGIGICLNVGKIIYVYEGEGLK